MPRKLVFHLRPQLDFPVNLNPTLVSIITVTMKEDEEDLTDSEEVPKEEGREITMAGSKESNNGGKTTTFMENDTVEIPTIFPPSFLTEVVFLSLAL